MISDYSRKRDRQMTRLGLVGPNQLPTGIQRQQSAMPSWGVPQMNNPYALVGAALRQHAGLPRTQSTSPRAMVAMMTGR